MSTFIEYKQTLEAQLQEKKRLLEDGAKEHATHVSDLERKHVQEKDRLKKEMLLKLRETKANLLKMTDNQLDTTTKRTIAENEQMSSELAWQASTALATPARHACTARLCSCTLRARRPHTACTLPARCLHAPLRGVPWSRAQSKETEKLIRKNDKLVAENQSLKRELSLHEQTEEEFARKVHVYQKTIKTLLAKLNTMDSVKRVDVERHYQEEEEREREKAEGQQTIEAMEGEASEGRRQLARAEDELARTQSAHAELQGKHAQLLSLQDDAVKFTLQCLQDMAEELAAPPPLLEDAEYSGAPLSLQTLDPTQREQVMRYLLDQLQAYQQQLRELQLQSQWRQSASREAFFPPLAPNSSAVAAGGGAPQDPFAPGLGMFGGAGALFQDSGQGRDAFPPGRGPGGASVGVQTASSQRAMFPVGIGSAGSVGVDPFDQRAEEAGSVIAVNGPVRPWGKRAKDLPLTRHTPSTFQKGHVGRAVR